MTDLDIARTKCACKDCDEELPDGWDHGDYCGRCINRCEPPLRLVGYRTSDGKLWRPADVEIVYVANGEA